MQRNLRARIIPVVFICFSSLALFGQGQSNQNWWFGNTNRGIQFSQPNDSAVLVTRPGNAFASYGNGGGAVLSDRITGGLLFYTDGRDVYDATHRLMPGGNGLPGNPASNQPASISAVPVVPPVSPSNRYYIFLNSATPVTAGQISFVEVDMMANGNSPVGGPPLGQVSTAPSPIAGLTAESEAMIVIPHQNGTDFWLITHTAGTSSFNVTPITATGVGPAVSIDPPGAVIPSFTASHFAYDSVRNRLAVAPSDVNKNVVLLDVDPQTGALAANANSIVFGSAVTDASLAQPMIYDVEFSPTGQYLYVSYPGDGGTAGRLIQFDLNNRLASPLQISDPGIARSWGLQLGADSALYHLYESGGAFLVGKINEPDSVAEEAEYESIAFTNHNFSAKQFPSFGLSEPNLTVDFTSVGECQNSPTAFFPTITPGADSVRWSFGDESGSGAWAPTHTYAEAGNFTVRLTAYASGDSAFVEKPVNIRDFTIQVTLPTQDTTACSCELTFPKAENPPTTYPNGSDCNPFTLTAQIQGSGQIQWYGPGGALAGQTGETLSKVDSAGYYYIVVSDGTCEAYAGVNIGEYGVEDPRSNVWHFGNGAGLNFNQSYKEDTGVDPIDGPVTSAEGVATISDENGEAILSTNGEQVYDREGNEAPNLPGGLGGSQQSSQSSLIIPFPGDPTLYYIFTTQAVYPLALSENYELRYSLFDLKNLPNGSLVDPDGNLANGVSTVLLTRSTERITGNEAWLIAHEFGTNNFLAYPITGEGIGAPVISSVGSVHSIAAEEEARGYMKLGAGNLLAVALNNRVEIFDFDNATGEVTNARTHNLPAGPAYGIEFSGARLFVSTTGGSSTMYEFEYDSTSQDYTGPTVIPGAPGELGAIETGPDGTIYVAVNGAGELATIQPNQNEGVPSVFGDAQPLGGNTSTLGLPNFIQSIGDALMTPSIVANGACIDNPVEFTATVTDPIDTVYWNFGDNQTDVTVGTHVVEHTYSEPGDYVVTANIRNRCIGPVDQLQSTITISPNPTALNGAISLCTGTEVLVGSNDADATFLWNTQETTRNIQPDAVGTYTVTVTNDAGCTDQGEYIVGDNRPQVDFGPDRTVCQRTGNINLDASNPGSTYVWTRNGAPLSTGQTITVSTNSASPATEYEVTINNPFTGCTRIENIVITINEEPDFDPTGRNTSGCEAQDGEIDIQINNTSGIFGYIVNGDGGTFSANDIAVPAGVITVTDLSAGAYNVFVQNQVTGCSDVQVVPISDDNTFTVTIAATQFCADNGLMPVNITLVDPQPTFTYNIYNSNNGQIVSTGDESTAMPTNLPLGTYVAEVQSGNCVAASDPTAITQGPEVNPVTVDVDACSVPNAVLITIDAPAAVGVTWFEDGALAPEIEDDLTIQRSPGVGNHTYRAIVKGDRVTTCDNIEVIPVIVDPNTPPSFSQTDACEDLVFLIAAPTGNYVYLWRDQNGDVINIGGPQISVTPTENGQTFSLEIQNTQTGCTLGPYEGIADVLGELTVDITNDPTCENLDFTVTATPSQAPDVYEWFFKEARLDDDGTSTVTVVDASPLNSGEYKVRVTKLAADPANNCYAKDSVLITVNPRTMGLLPEKGIICPDEANTDPLTKTVDLDPGDFLTYAWEYNGVPIGSGEPVLTATEAGLYTVSLIDFANCPSDDFIELVEECDPQITGPNAFRPGGVNKEFGLFTFFIADEGFEVYIFNRWGEMVFTDTQRTFKWNGGYKNNPGNPLPPGTYTYLVKYRSSYRPELGTLEYRGGVVLLR